MFEGLGKIFLQISEKYKEKIAIRYKASQKWMDITYKQLADDVRSLSHFFSENKIKSGDKIAVILPNRPEWSMIFFSSMLIGAVVVPINADASESEIEVIIKHSESKLIMIHDGFGKEKAEKLQKISCVEKIISVDSEEFNKNKNLKKDIEGASVKKDTLACLLYTSGTTGDPKGVMLSHGNFYSNCQSLFKANILFDIDIFFSILPLHHVYPLCDTLIFPLTLGSQIVYPGTLRSEQMFEAMQEANPTVLFAVPRIYRLFYNKMNDAIKSKPFVIRKITQLILKVLYFMKKVVKIDMTKKVFRSIHDKFGNQLRFFVTGGDKLDEDIAKGLLTLGFTILEGYGLSETSPLVTFNSLSKPKIGSAGRAIADVQVKIMNKDQKGIGEVIVRGENVMQGYYKREDLTAQVIKDGWFYTGDLGYLDKEGYLFITGRSKDIIVLSSGLNIYPDEIETAYLAHPCTKEMCIFDIENKETKTMALWAIVVPDLEYFQEESELNLREVLKGRLENIAAELPAYKHLMGFTVSLKPLPRTSLGKLQRFKVKEQYLNSISKDTKNGSKDIELSDEDKELLAKDSSKIILESLKKQIRTKRVIIPDDCMEIDLGIDSIARIELAVEMEKHFGIKINDEFLGQYFTVRELLKAMDELIVSGKNKERLVDDSEKINESAKWDEILNSVPEAESTKDIKLELNFFEKAFYLFFLKLCRLILKTFFRLKVEGLEKVPKKGACIIYANHSSMIDPFVLIVALNRGASDRAFFLGFSRYIIQPIRYNLLKIVGVIPLDFKAHFIGSLRSCYYVLKKQRSICEFPEGRVSIDNKMEDFKKGFGITVKEANVPVVPVLIEGASKAMPRTAKWPRPFPIKVTFSDMISAEDLLKRGKAMGEEDPYMAVCTAAKDVLLKMKEK